MAQATSHISDKPCTPVYALTDRELSERTLAELLELRALLDNLAAAFTTGGVRGFRRALGGGRSE